LHALGAHFPSVQSVQFLDLSMFDGWPRETCDLLGSCCNLASSRYLRGVSAVRAFDDAGLRVKIVQVAGAVCPVPPPSFQVGAVPILPACLRLLTERWPRLSLHTAGTQRRSKEHCTPTEPCQQRRTESRDWAGLQGGVSSVSPPRCTLSALLRSPQRLPAWHGARQTCTRTRLSACVRV